MPLPFIDGVEILKNLGVSPIAFAKGSRKVSSLSGKNSMMDLLNFLKVKTKKGIYLERIQEFLLVICKSIVPSVDKDQITNFTK